MSENVLKFLLSELTTIRVHCRARQCGVAVEIPIDQLEQRFRGMDCPVCHAQLLAATPDGDNAFINLAKAVRRFTSNPGTVEIEFVLPVKSV